MFGLIIKVAQSTGLTEGVELHVPSFTAGTYSPANAGMPYTDGHGIAFCLRCCIFADACVHDRTSVCKRLESWLKPGTDVKVTCEVLPVDVVASI